MQLLCTFFFKKKSLHLPHCNVNWFGLDLCVLCGIVYNMYLYMGAVSIGTQIPISMEHPQYSMWSPILELPLPHSPLPPPPAVQYTM